MIPFVAKKIPDYKNIKEILSISKRHNTFTNHGPVKFLLEQKLERLLNISADKRVICLNSGTAALHALLFLCEKKHNAYKWAIPDFNFPSAMVGNKYNISVFDVDLNTHTIHIDEKLDLYDGVILTNLFGSYVDLEFWQDLTQKNNQFLIFDNASSPLSTYNGINVCNFGHYAFGSLHHTKYLGFGEGGFAIIPKEDYNEIAGITNFGFMDNRTFNKLSSNFKMSDVSAAFILSHIENYDIERHMQIQNTILNEIKINPMGYKEGVIYGNLPLLFDRNVYSNEFNKIVTHKYYMPLVGLKNAQSLFNRIINLPLYSALTDNDIDIIIQGINEFIRNDKKIC